MRPVEGQMVPSSHGSIKPITFDIFDALCDELSGGLSIYAARSVDSPDDT